ncbi:MAG TPA: hypothetical protein VM674_02335, partial [Candidatus Acidoferrum sp.]|nr:hypothetical protein [Candidatus Acidoferrum sp.]
MKFTTIAGTALIGGTILSTMMLGPVHSNVPAPSTVTASLPMTGSYTAVLRIKHGMELEGPITPTDLY